MTPEIIKQLEVTIRTARDLRAAVDEVQESKRIVGDHPLGDGASVSLTRWSGPGTVIYAYNVADIDANKQLADAFDDYIRPAVVRYLETAEAILTKAYAELTVPVVQGEVAQ